MSGRRHLQTGRAAEDAALAYLQAQGLNLLHRNYRCRLGELDLVMRDGTTVVVAEVRYRGSARTGGAAASVDEGKRRRLVAATRHLLAMSPVLSGLAVRFDVIAIEQDRGGLRWIRDAFRLSD